MRRQEQFNKKLLVEGNDDQHVVWALCKKFNIEKTFDVVDCEGIDNLTQEITVRFKLPDTTIGIIVDADTNLENRLTALKNILTIQGFTIPEVLPNEGIICSNGDNKKVGVWIMPNNNANGILEDFITFLVPHTDMLLSVVNSTLDHIEEKKLNNYFPKDKSKAVIHTWLAWQKDPGIPMGQAITKRYLSTDEATCLLLIQWLKILFN